MAANCSGGSGAAAAPARVALILAGPVRSLLQPAVHTTIEANFWRAFGGRAVLFARLFDVRQLDRAARDASVVPLLAF